LKSFGLHTGDNVRGAAHETWRRLRLKLMTTRQPRDGQPWPWALEQFGESVGGDNAGQTMGPRKRGSTGFASADYTECRY
jgi:hypothetical protein